jgi:hypothetical protein
VSAKGPFLASGKQHTLRGTLTAHQSLAAERLACRAGLGSTDGQSAYRSHIHLGYSQEDLAERAGLHRN